MKIYWGGADSGKLHLIKYAKLNSKTYARFKDYQIIKQYTTCKDYDYDVNDRLWWNVIENFFIYYKRKDEETIRTSNFTRERFVPLYFSSNNNNYCNQNWGKESEMKWDNRILLKPEQFRKYLGKEYIDTEIYNRIIFTANVSHTFDRIIDYKDKFCLDEVSKDVDLLFLFVHTDGDKTNEMEYYSNKFRNHHHIIPFKEDMVDSIASKLDKVGHLGYHLNGCNMMDLYNNRKNELWAYLDTFSNHIERVKNILNKLGIPFTYFNLDRDNYVDVFGWGDNPLDNKTTHLHDTFESDINYDRWQDCIKIAKEYLSDRVDRHPLR